MDEFILGPAQAAAFLTEKLNQRMKGGLSRSMLPSHSKGIIRIKADETKTGALKAHVVNHYPQHRDSVCVDAAQLCQVSKICATNTKMHKLTH